MVVCLHECAWARSLAEQMKFELRTDTDRDVAVSSSLLGVLGTLIGFVV